MGAPRLLRFRGPRLRAGDADVLRPRTALGQRRPAGRLGLTLRGIADALLAVALAPACAACGAALESPTRGPVCQPCWRSILPHTAPFWRHEHVDAALAAGIYDGSLRAIVHALKYDGRRSLAAPLAALMRARCGDLLAGASCAVPVPLHRSRQRERGFNQAADLARHIGLPVCFALRRVRATPTQTGLGSAERRENVHGAFAVARKARGLAGRVIVLIDDVCTTGATLEACGSALKEAGAAEVRAVTAARAVR